MVPSLTDTLMTCSRLATLHFTSCLLVLSPAASRCAGPGHGAPAILSCLYMEGSITRFYPQYDESAQGLEKFVRAFSFPGGFPSHVNAETPGASE